MDATAAGAACAVLQRTASNAANATGPDACETTPATAATWAFKAFKPSEALSDDKQDTFSLPREESQIEQENGGMFSAKVLTFVRLFAPAQASLAEIRMAAMRSDSVLWWSL